MEPQDSPEPQPEKSREQAAQHVADAHNLLKSLRERVDRHPELEEAIEKIEMALSILTTKTGGML